MAEHCDIRRVDRIADVIAATVLGAVAAAAWLHWASGCEPEATLCMLAITPTRIAPVQRLLLWLRAARLRMLIRSFETEAAHWHEAATVAPDRLAACEARIAELRVQLIDCGTSAADLR